MADLAKIKYDFTWIILIHSMLYPLNMQYLQYLICTVATNLFFRIVKYIQVKEIIKKEKMKGRVFYPSIVDGGRSESEFTVNCEVRIFFLNILIQNYIFFL